MLPECSLEFCTSVLVWRGMCFFLGLKLKVEVDLRGHRRLGVVLPAYVKQASEQAEIPVGLCSLQGNRNVEVVTK